VNQRLVDFLRNRTTRRVALDAAALVAAVVMGVIAFSAAAHGELGVGPARLAISIAPATSPLTVVEVPPFGSVEAVTHEGPVRLDVRVESIDVASTQRLVTSGALSTSRTLAADSVAGLPLTGFTALLWRVIGGGALAAALAGLLVGLALRRGRAVVALAVALAVSVPAAGVGVAYATWDASAFREPTLRGSLVYAPQLIDIFSTRVARIRKLRAQAVQVATNLAAYYANDRSLASGGALPGTFRVLHITDLHLDPVGAELARSVARSYEASVVVETGDLPILGAPVETSAFASLVDTSVPLVYVPGNHDSPASLHALRRLGATVLTSGTVEVRGLRIFGVADPSSRGSSYEPDAVAVTDAARLAAAQLAGSLRSGEATPDVVAVHSPLMDAPFIGLVPLVLSGHTHVASFSIVGGTVLLNSGTLGGMPYDLKASGGAVRPYSASVLYFTARMPRRLIAIDRIDVYPDRSTTVSRQVIDESLLP
jgi:predicted phosphodiesterase